ncbi:hypothetical protein [Nocardia aurantiaca]|uniref:Uncharacterized protein n=1 Tax=Nocardia aurantiaca TaxID=2675850 RepID=A0A6I3KZE4_9NOCA|nr:hypothetical protein [Nocardia aurantiaca]MTE13614.1 hypothetical protein [Nocardia aurantiaca]
MRAVVSEIDTLGSDLGFDSIPWGLRSDRSPDRMTEVATHPVADRRPCRARVRPTARQSVRPDHLVARHAARRARGMHPLERVRRAQIGLAALAVSALVSALAVAALIGLAQLRSGDFDSQTAPPSVRMVQAPAR